jgi:hypothetical protein
MIAVNGAAEKAKMTDSPFLFLSLPSTAYTSLVYTETFPESYSKIFTNLNFNLHLNSKLSIDDKQDKKKNTKSKSDNTKKVEIEINTGNSYEVGKSVSGLCEVVKASVSDYNR